MNNFVKWTIVLLLTAGTSLSSYAEGRNYREGRNGNNGPGRMGPNRPGPGPGMGNRGPNRPEGRGPGMGNRGPNRPERGPGMGNRGPNRPEGRGPGMGNRGPNRPEGRGPGMGNRGPNRPGPGGDGRGPNRPGPGPGYEGRGPNRPGPGHDGRGPGYGGRGPNRPGPGHDGRGPGYGGRGPNRPGPGHDGRGPGYNRRPIPDRWIGYHNRYGHRDGWNFGRNYRYSRYNHVPYRNIPHGHFTYHSPRDFFRTIPYRFIYWNNWVRFRVNYGNGYYWWNNYPWFVYNGYQHRYSDQDVCNYELVDGRQNQAVDTYYGQFCNVGYDRCAYDRDMANSQVGEYRYFCSERVDDEDYGWDYNDDFYSDIGNDGYYNDEY